MLLQGKFTPTNPEKYDGDPTRIIYRSGWELSVMLWCDSNSFITEWSSEEIVIPYLCKTDNKKHRYFIDFKMTFRDGRTIIVELKPKIQVLPPTKTKGKREKTFMNEQLTYVKNASKWEAAKKWAAKQNYTFYIWTEDEMRKLGIKIITPEKRLNKFNANRKRRSN